MARLSKNSTVNGERIIHQDIANEHSHYLINIEDFGIIAGKDIGEDGGVYAERIHGYTLNDLYERYLHDNNHIMQGFLKINNFTDDKSLINKQYIDQYSNETVLDDSLNSIPSTVPIAISRTSDTVVATNIYGEIDRSRFDINNIKNEFRPSLNGPTQVQVGETYVYRLTNFNTFSNYNISLSDGGVIYIDEEEIRLETNVFNEQDRYITLNIDLDNEVYEYDIYFLEGSL